MLSCYVHRHTKTFCQALFLRTSKVTAVVSVTLIAVDIQGGDLSEPLVLLWHRHWVKQTPNSYPQLALIHHKHTKSSHSAILIAWKSVEGGVRIVAWAVVTTRYVYPGILHHS